mmetsp:Transcript_2555/g.5381  ORF Transcript_2555/g.5381 Transcript_2555/m.5381 type:complete len:386 (+) Transcript_2555:205-1362(+)
MISDPPNIPVDTMFAHSLNLNSPRLQSQMAESSSIPARLVPQTLSIGSEIGSASTRTVTRLPQDPMDQEGVELLLGIATIVSKEMANSDKELFGDESGCNFRTNGERSSFPSFCQGGLAARVGTNSLSSPSLFHKDLDDDDFAWNRVRTVSIDNGYKSPRRSPDVEEAMSMAMSIRMRSSTTKTKSSPLPVIVSPVNTRLRTNRKPSIKLLAHKRKKEQIKFPKLVTQQQKHSPNNQNQNLPNIMSRHRSKAQEESSIKGKSITVIHRKKFSWKNYPELEAFLVANREEYLRHSALNYTIQQKKYNNRLTERLLDLAAQHQYVFNEEEFNFVTVRDRIRCFYKSYVQSSKKRGIVLGYAARKAGILTKADLQKSVGKEGTIVNPL